MTDNERYVSMVLEDVSTKLSGKNAANIIGVIAQKYAGKPLVLEQEDQYLLGAILGAMLHQAYCDSRKLKKPNENGLPNDPRLKILDQPIDQEFVEKVKSGEIPTSSTLYVDENGNVVMDIANTSFIHLSPYWQKDNFLAGCAATRSILTCYNGLTHNDPNVRRIVEVAVANAIHEAWIARGNVYYKEYNGEVYTNRELDTAYINLPSNEKDKDLEHYKMAMTLIGELVREMGQGQPGDN